MSADRHVSWMCQIVDSERPWSLQCHALMQMILGIAIRIMQKKKNVVEFTIGCFASKVMIFKVKELNRK